MRHFFTQCLFLFALAFVSCQTSQAFEAIYIEDAGVEMGVGYRSDQLEWSIAGDMAGENPNILSELRWEDLDIFQIEATGWLKLGELPLIKKPALVLADISIGKIFSGNAQDSDYARDNRTFEWSQSVSNSDKGMTVDISGAVGPIIDINMFKGLSVTPLVGYGFNMQALAMTGGEQTISNPFIRWWFFGPEAERPLPKGPIPHLDSSYTTYWYGPWLGVDIDYQASEKFKLSVGLEYHWVEYFAQADWNLRSDFEHPVSFEHETTGTGIVWNIKGFYRLNESWSWLLHGNIQNWETERGTDRTFFNDGSVGKSRLNQVNWDSYALMTGVQYQF